MFLYFLLLLFCCSSAVYNKSVPESIPSYTPLSGPPEYSGDDELPHVVPAAFPAYFEPDRSETKNGSHSKRAEVNKRLNITKKDEKFVTGPLMTTVIPSIYILVFIISGPLNAAAVFMFSLRVRPKKPAAIYMLNLATADLLFVLLLPFKASYHYNGNDWVFGSAMCRVVTSAFYCNMYCSVLLITCISADRFLAVVYPIRSLMWRSQRNAVVVCCTMWLLAVAGVMPILLSEQTVYLWQLNITTCHDVLDIREQQGYYLYFFPTFSCLFFFIPLIITTACYVCIIRALHRSNNSKRSKKTQAMVMAVTVLIVFVVCFTPSNVLLLIHYTQFAHQPNGYSYIAYLISMCIGTVNCCLDPIMYYFGSSQCRKKVAHLLGSKVPAENSQATTSGTYSM